MELFSSFIDHALAFVREAPMFLSLLTLLATAFAEFVFPPVPGDTFALVGGILSGQGALPLVGTIVALTIGSTLGGLVAFAFGRYAERNPWAHDKLRRILSDKRLEQLIALFERHGRGLVVANRFIPGLRAYVLVGAGLAGMSVVDVTVFGAVSALAWNSALVAAGYAVGENLDLLLSWMQKYTVVAWVLMGVGGVIIFVRWLYKRRVAPDVDDDAVDDDDAGASS